MGWMSDAFFSHKEVLFLIAWSKVICMTVRVLFTFWISSRLSISQTIADYRTPYLNLITK